MLSGISSLSYKLNYQNLLSNYKTRKHKRHEPKRKGVKQLQWLKSSPWKETACQIKPRTEVVTGRCSIEKGVLKNFTKFRSQAYNLSKKETLAQMFFCQICEIFKNTFVYRTALMAASARILHTIIRKQYEYYINTIH